MWARYRAKLASFPALAVYLTAAHHGKLRTVLRSTTQGGEDVFGVPTQPDSLAIGGQVWPLDFSISADGAAGEWTKGGFVLTDHGWTGLVSDLLGPREREAVENNCATGRNLVTNERAVLPVVPVPGLRSDSLGNYLASLGLVRALAHSRWPRVRAAWKTGVLHIVGGPSSINDTVNALWDIAEKQAWTPYDRAWKDTQKQGTKKKSPRPLSLWQAGAAERDLEMFNAHAVPATTVSFNPLLGNGGSSGNRDFSDGWKRAIAAFRTEQTDAGEKRADLERLLVGSPVTWMIEKLNAACWFSDANKLYNSGQRPYREGAISPWAMSLACEGLTFFAGSSSRRLGSRARAGGAFPFVTRAAAPCGAGEAGHDLAEVWAPTWERPMTLPEVVTLFSRGRAESGGRGVLTPSAFATAVVRRGVDAGITEFRRFILGRTTSANTFESRFEGVFHVRDSGATTQADRSGSVVMQRLLSLVEQFVGPLADRKVGQRWRYVGLRGGIEAGCFVWQRRLPTRKPVALCSILSSPLWIELTGTGHSASRMSCGSRYL
jgi:hypothetical protein